jgi:hypothetical protein
MTVFLPHEALGKPKDIGDSFSGALSNIAQLYSISKDKAAIDASKRKTLADLAEEERKRKVREAKSAAMIARFDEMQVPPDDPMRAMAQPDTIDDLENYMAISGKARDEYKDVVRRQVSEFFFNMREQGMPESYLLAEIPNRFGQEGIEFVQSMKEMNMKFMEMDEKTRNMIREDATYLVNMIDEGQVKPEELEYAYNTLVQRYGKDEVDGIFGDAFTKGPEGLNQVKQNAVRILDRVSMADTHQQMQFRAKEEARKAETHVQGRESHGWARDAAGRAGEMHELDVEKKQQEIGEVPVTIQDGMAVPNRMDRGAESMQAVPIEGLPDPQESTEEVSRKQLLAIRTIDTTYKRYGGEGIGMSPEEIAANPAGALMAVLAMNKTDGIYKAITDKAEKGDVQAQKDLQAINDAFDRVQRLGGTGQAPIKPITRDDVTPQHKGKGGGGVRDSIEQALQQGMNKKKTAEPSKADAQALINAIAREMPHLSDEEIIEEAKRRWNAR